MRTALLLAALVASAPISRAADGADPLARFGWLRELAGACWTGTYAGGKTSDTQCYDVQWNRFLRGTITLSGEHQGTPASDFRGDSIFAWSAKRERIVYTNWSSDGGYGTGEAFVDGDAIVFPDPRRAGQQETRNRWTRLGAESYEVVREQRDGDGWKETLRVTYRRVR